MISAGEDAKSGALPKRTVPLGDPHVVIFEIQKGCGITWKFVSTV